MDSCRISIKDFPDPSQNGDGVGISIRSGPGGDLNPNNPQFASAQKACQHLVGNPPGRAGSGLVTSGGPGK